MFRNAIVRLPGQSIKDGITTSDLGIPDFEMAVEQHAKYTDVLKILGLNVTILQANELYPDSTFVEDIAICSPGWAVITNPGAASRKGEISGIMKTFKHYFEDIEAIIPPGTLEGGDIMKVGDHYYIGISDRTNNEGADQLIRILHRHGKSGEKVQFKNILHLKSGVSYLENNIMIVAKEIAGNTIFNNYERIMAAENESYAANSLWVNGKVLVPEGFPKTRKKIENTGYETITLNVSEFRKIDGGLSCLSLRF